MCGSENTGGLNMSKVFISFLGTNSYLECNYYYGDKKINNVKYIQEALINIFCSKFKERDRLLFFLTKDAKANNWDNEDGLYNRLKQLDLPVSVNAIDIEEGNSESSIWKIFETIFEALEQQDEVYFDITHGFRSLPMLGIVLMNYARFLKRIKVKGIYYGAFETLGPVYKIKEMDLSDRNAPIFNLTDFDNLQQWSIAVNNFVDFGNSKYFGQLVYSKVNPLIQNSTDLIQQAILESKIAKKLDIITSMFQTNRCEEIINGKEIVELKNILSKIDKQQVLVSPIRYLLEAISDKLHSFQLNQLSNGFIAAAWCKEHDLVQQGLTILREMIITHICGILNLDRNDSKEREFISSLLYFKANPQAKADDKWQNTIVNRKDEIYLIRDNPVIDKISKSFEKIRTLRNDINHAGFVKNRKKNPVSIKAEFEKLFDELQNILGINWSNP